MKTGAEGELHLQLTKNSLSLPRTDTHMQLLKGSQLNCMHVQLPFQDTWENWSQNAPFQDIELKATSNAIC